MHKIYKINIKRLASSRDWALTRNRVYIYIYSTSHGTALRIQSGLASFVEGEEEKGPSTHSMCMRQNFCKISITVGARTCSVYEALLPRPPQKTVRGQG